MGKSRNVDTREEKIGTTGIVHIGPENDIKVDEVEVVSDVMAAKKKAEILAFMEEMMTIEVATSTDKFAEPVVEVWNDGRVQRFIRGQEMTVKRKYVEVLARAKPDGFGSQEFTDGDGNRSYRYPKTTSLKYPFRVIRDDNPRGADWLRGILNDSK